MTVRKANESLAWSRLRAHARWRRDFRRRALGRGAGAVRWFLLSFSGGGAGAVPRDRARGGGGCPRCSEARLGPAVTAAPPPAPSPRSSLRPPAGPLPGARPRWVLRPSPPAPSPPPSRSPGSCVRPVTARGEGCASGVSVQGAGVSPRGLCVQGAGVRLEVSVSRGQGRECGLEC